MAEKTGQWGLREGHAAASGNCQPSSGVEGVVSANLSSHRLTACRGYSSAPHLIIWVPPHGEDPCHRSASRGRALR